MAAPPPQADPRMEGIAMASGSGRRGEEITRHRKPVSQSESLSVAPKVRWSPGVPAISPTLPGATWSSSM